ncbi:hypothetical protein OHA71_06590 [Streptomyces sp. NBC_00444]|uniref:hypothetical protein n=1 Tax=Streptomyces sp. NBC_00444 TaxID=2975744 RepID=UPI002E1C86FE
MEALAFIALVVAVAAPLCGHQGQPFPLARAARCALAWRPQKRSRDSRATTGAERPADGRMRARPTWAHSQPLDYEEAA